MYEKQDETTRLELALALARIVGNESHFIQLWRNLRAEPTTSAARAVVDLKKKLEKLHAGRFLLRDEFDLCAETFAHGDMPAGTKLFGQVLQKLPLSSYGGACTLILSECATRLAEVGADRREYLLLALHTLDACLLH
jgi:hypothetical protein